MFSLIGTIIIGFIVGLIARAIHPGKDKAGFLVTTFLGIVGAGVASYGGQLLGMYEKGQSAGFIASVVGAVVVLAIYNLATKKD